MASSTGSTVRAETLEERATEIDASRVAVYARETREIEQLPYFKPSTR